MPIINRGPDSQESGSERPGIIPKKDTADQPPPNVAVSDAPRSGPSRWIWIFAAVAAVGLGTVAALSFDAIPTARNALTVETTLGRTATVDAEILRLNVDKLVRVAGLSDLTQRKIEQNRNALELATAQQDEVIADTMKLALAQNLKDLSEYREAHVSELTKLQVLYAQSPESVELELKARLKSSEDAFKVGNALAIQEALTLFKSLPEDADAKTYFKEKIDGKVQ